MKTLSVAVKTFMGLGLLASFIALAGTMNNSNFYSDSFMGNEEMIFVSQIDESSTRFVASYTKKVAPSFSLRPSKVTLANSSKINGKWEILKISFDNGGNLEDVYYDKVLRYEDRSSYIEVNLELVGESVVRLNDDQTQIYKTLFFNQNGTIGLFKSYKNGYEIITAKWVGTSVESVDVAASSIKTEKAKIIKNGLNSDEDLYLVEALDPSINSKHIKNSAVSGKAYITNGEISLEDIVLHVGTKNETVEPLSLTARIGDGNVFKAEYGDKIINGIVTSDGRGGYRVRFATGPLQGAYLTFITETKHTEAVEKMELAMENTDEREEFVAPKGLEKRFQAVNSQQEEEDLSESELDEEEELSEEEMAQTTVEKGFNFS